MSGMRSRLSPTPPGGPPPAPVSLHIDRLVLDGLSLAMGGSDRLHAELVAELESLFSSGRVHPDLRAGGSRPSLRLSIDGLRDGADPEHLGRRIASALHGGIGS